MMPFACVLTLVAALGGAACANAQSAQPPPVAAGSDPQQVVATVGDKKITMEDVEARWQKDDPAERARVTQLLYQHRRQSIDQIVGDVLIDAAAKKAGGQPGEVPRGSAVEAARRDHRGRDQEGLRREPRARRRLDARGPARVDHRVHRPQPRRAEPGRPGRRAQGGGAAGEHRARPAALPGGDRRPRPEPRAGRRAGDGGRVLGVPVPVLRSRLAHAEAAVEKKYGGQGAVRLQGLPAAQPPAGAQGRRSRALRRRSGQVLGAARPAVRQPAAAAGARAEGPCQGRGARSGGLRPVPRLGQARRHRAGGSRAGQPRWACSPRRRSTSTAAR